MFLNIFLTSNLLSLVQTSPDASLSCPFQQENLKYLAFNAILAFTNLSMSSYLCLHFNRRLLFKCVNVRNQFYHQVISELVLAVMQKKRRLRSNNGDMLQQFNKLGSVNKVEFLHSSFLSLFGSWSGTRHLRGDEWERRRHGMKTEVLEGRDG